MSNASPKPRATHASLLAVFTLCMPLSGADTIAPIPTPRYDPPDGFVSGNNLGAATWISDNLDAVIHVYPFRTFEGDFQSVFRRGLFRDWVSALYREDRLLAQPVITLIRVKGAAAAVSAAFKNYNSGAPREHLRVAILAAGSVAIVDFSANSPQAFERNRESVSRLLNSLRVL